MPLFGEELKSPSYATKRTPNEIFSLTRGKSGGRRALAPFLVPTNCLSRVYRRKNRGAATSKPLGPGRKREGGAGPPPGRGSSFLGRLLARSVTGSTGIFLEACVRSLNAELELWTQGRRRLAFYSTVARIFLQILHSLLSTEAETSRASQAPYSSLYATWRGLI